MSMRANWPHRVVQWSTEGLRHIQETCYYTQTYTDIPKKIQHAGFYREIISRNPPLVDEDGYEVDSEDDDERAQAASAAAAEFDPYAAVKIESMHTLNSTKRPQ